MKKLFFFLICAGFVAAVLFLFFSKQPKNKQDQGLKTDLPTNAKFMKITSPAFAQNQSIPQKYSCEGQSINPPLEFSDVPKEAKSLALIMDDPDVPKNLKPDGLFVHWVVFNIPPATPSLAENQTPTGILGNNGAGKPAYAGPCPPDREHRYFFKLYALDSMLKLPAGANKDDVEKAMAGHILEQAQLVGLYNKKGNPQ